VRIEEHDKESRLAQVSVVKKGRWKLKALHIKVGGCKQFNIRAGLQKRNYSSHIDSEREQRRGIIKAMSLRSAKYANKQPETHVKESNRDHE